MAICLMLYSRLLEIVCTDMTTKSDNWFMLLSLDDRITGKWMRQTLMSGRGAIDADRFLLAFSVIVAWTSS